MYLLPHSVAWPEAAPPTPPTVPMAPRAPRPREPPAEADPTPPAVATAPRRRSGIVIEVSVEQLLVVLGFAALVAWVLALHAKVARLSRALADGAR